MKYFVAITVVALICGAGIRFITQTHRELRDLMREALNSPEVQSQLSDEEKQALADGNLSGFGTELPASLMSRIQSANLLRTFWFVWVPLVFGLGIAIVTFWPNSTATSSATTDD